MSIKEATELLSVCETLTGEIATLIEEVECDILGGQLEDKVGELHHMLFAVKKLLK